MESGMNRWINRLMVTAALAGAVVSGKAYAQAPFKVEARWTIGGEGSWDYLTVDSAAKRLYIAHQTKVDVIDLATGKQIGAVIGLTRCHGVILSPDGKTGFVSDGGANAVVAFDLNNFAQTDKIAAGTNPDGMAFEPVTGTLWAFNGTSKNATVIDASTHKVVGTVALPGKPEFPVADGAGTVFVNIEDTNSVVRIDAKTMKLTDTIKTGGGTRVDEMTYDPKKKIWMGANNAEDPPFATLVSMTQNAAINTTPRPMAPRTSGLPHPMLLLP